MKAATPMHIMAAAGSADRLVDLLNAGGDPNAVAGDGTRPLACARGEAIELLRARGATE